MENLPIIYKVFFVHVKWLKRSCSCQLQKTKVFGFLQVERWVPFGAVHEALWLQQFVAGKKCESNMSNEKKHDGYFLYIGDYTTHL